MLTRWSLFSALRLATKDNWARAAEWLGYSLLGSLVPLWGQMFVLPLFSRRLELVDLVRHGEFVLYSAAFLAPAVYVVARDFRTIQFPSRLLFILIAGFALIVSALVYGGLLTAEKLSGQEGLAIIPDERYLLGVSFVLFAVSVILSFLIALLDNVRVDFDLYGETVQKVNLAEEVEQLGKENE